MAAELGEADEAHAIALEGRITTNRDDMGLHEDRPAFLFHQLFAAFRRDPRFVRHCARLGLVEYWMTSQHWPDCVDEVAPYYDFKAECAKVAAGPPLPPANETASPAPAA